MTEAAETALTEALQQQRKVATSANPCDVANLQAAQAVDAARKALYALVA